MTLLKTPTTYLPRDSPTTGTSPDGSAGAPNGSPGITETTGPGPRFSRVGGGRQAERTPSPDIFGAPKLQATLNRVADSGVGRLVGHATLSMAAAALTAEIHPAARLLGALGLTALPLAQAFRHGSLEGAIASALDRIQRACHIGGHALNELGLRATSTILGAVAASEILEIAADAGDGDPIMLGLATGMWAATLVAAQISRGLVSRSVLNGSPKVADSAA